MAVLLLPDSFNSIMDHTFTRLLRYAALCATLMGLFSCGDLSGSGTAMQFSADMESGNLPLVTQLDVQGRAVELALRDDNDDASLPDSFRSWWFFRIDQVPVGQSVHFEFSRLGFSYYFVPVYSYDGKNWLYFDEKDVTLAPGCDVGIPESCRLIIDTKFTASTVWMARTFPYTTQDLSQFLSNVAANSYLQIDTIGYAPKTLKPIQLLTISDESIRSPKHTVWIHARTHPAETGPSFLLEGLIRAALREDALGESLRRQYMFKIVPMQNIDGVVLGNYRTNSSSINLENQWQFYPGNRYLNDSAPFENRLTNQFGMVPAMVNQAAPVTLALNLHSSNSEPDTGAFFFPHFGSDPAVYTPGQQRLWSRQLDFISLVAHYYDGRIEQPPDNGGAEFLTSFYPESWWWANAADSVNAITLETTYGRAGYDHWVLESDLRFLGEAVARAIAAMDSAQLRSKNSGVENELPTFRLPFKPEIYLRQPD